MTNQIKSQSPRLKINASKSFNRFGVFIYLIALIGIPFLGWTGFGPGSPGDTTVNGNSLLVFWGMRITLFALWCMFLLGIRRSWLLMQKLPRLFTLDKYGVTDRFGITTPWTEFQRAYYNGRAWKLYLDVQPCSQYKNRGCPR